MQAHARSPSAHGRRAALVALAVIAAGCAEALLTKLDSVVPWLVAACKDTDHIVREAACLTVSQLAQFLQPDILRHAPTILPRLLEARRRPARPARSATRPLPAHAAAASSRTDATTEANLLTDRPVKAGT